MMQSFIIILFQILLVVTPLIFYTGAMDHFLVKDTITQAIIFFVAGIGIIIWLEKRARLVKGNLFYVLPAFLGFGLLSLINSTHKFLSFRVWLMFVAYALVYFLAINFFQDKKVQDKIYKTVFVTATIVAVYGILQCFGIDFITWQNEFNRRSSSTFGNPNFLAGYLVVVLPLMIGYWFSDYSSERNGSRNHQQSIGSRRLAYSAPTINVGAAKAGQPAQYLLSLQIILVFICLILTQTRGSWIAFLISFMVLVAGIFRFSVNKKVVPYLAATFLVLVIILLPQIWSRTKTFFDMNNSSVIERIFKWQTALEMVKDYPVTGVGLGNLKVKYALYQAKVKDLAKFPLRGTSESNVHNDYLQVLAETGVLGILTYLSVFILFFWKLPSLLRGEGQGEVSPLLIGLISAVTGFLVYSLTNFPLSISPTATLLFLCLGLAEVVGQPQTPERPDKKTKPVFFSRWELRIVVAAVYFTILTVFVLPPFVAETYRTQASVYQSERMYGRALEYYEKAIKTDFYRSEFTAYNLGMLYVTTFHDYDKAIDSFKKSIALRNYGEVYNDLANCYYLKGMAKEAVTNWETALKLGLPNPQDQSTVTQNLEKLRTPKK